MAKPEGQIEKQFSIVGSSFVLNADAYIRRLRAGHALTLMREPTNKYDGNAILVLFGKQKLGYVPRGLASQIAPLMDAGVNVIAIKDKNPLYGVCRLAYVPPAVPVAAEQAVEDAAAAQAEADGQPASEFEAPPTEVE